MGESDEDLTRRTGLTQKGRKLRAQRAAHSRWAGEDANLAMREVREKGLTKLRNMVLAEAAKRGESLSENEIERRIAAKQAAHMAGMTLKAAQARESARFKKSA